jgi:hypothetical protein
LKTKRLQDLGESMSQLDGLKMILLAALGLVAITCLNQFIVVLPLWFLLGSNRPDGITVAILVVCSFALAILELVCWPRISRFWSKKKIDNKQPKDGEPPL